MKYKTLSEKGQHFVIASSYGKEIFRVELSEISPYDFVFLGMNCEFCDFVNHVRSEFKNSFIYLKMVIDEISKAGFIFGFEDSNEEILARKLLFNLPSYKKCLSLCKKHKKFFDEELDVLVGSEKKKYPNFSKKISSMKIQSKSFPKQNVGITEFLRTI